MWPSPTPETQEELDKYEKFINDEIFIPSWDTMTEQVYQGICRYVTLHEYIKLFRLQKMKNSWCQEASIIS